MRVIALSCGQFHTLLPLTVNRYAQILCTRVYLYALCIPVSLSLSHSIYLLSAPFPSHPILFTDAHPLRLLPIGSDSYSASKLLFKASQLQSFSASWLLCFPGFIDTWLHRFM